MRNPKHILSEMTLWVFVLVVALGMVLILAGRAFPHEDASWIQEKHPECCGIEDCSPVPPLAIYRDAQGWKLDSVGGYVLPSDIKPSIDDKPWACVPPMSDYLMCLFLPIPKLRM